MYEGDLGESKEVYVWCPRSCSTETYEEEGGRSRYVGSITQHDVLRSEWEQCPRHTHTYRHLLQRHKRVSVRPLASLDSCSTAVCVDEMKKRGYTSKGKRDRDAEGGFQNWLQEKLRVGVPVA